MGANLLVWDVPPGTVLSGWVYTLLAVQYVIMVPTRVV
jgi:hypothetical protein